jgi:hypothetical protein
MPITLLTNAIHGQPFYLATYKSTGRCLDAVIERIPAHPSEDQIPVSRFISTTLPEPSLRIRFMFTRSTGLGM